LGGCFDWIKPQKTGKITVILAQRGLIFIRVVIKDKLVLGSLAGIIADIIQDLFQLGLEKLNLIKFSLDNFAGSMFIRVSNNSMITGHLGWMVGNLSGAALSIILGIIFVYVIDLSGFRFIITKGILYGFILWYIIYGGFMAALHISYLQDFDPFHALIFVIVHLLFGLSLGIVVAKLGVFAIKV
jgi:hypothetical protein